MLICPLEALLPCSSGKSLPSQDRFNSHYLVTFWTSLWSKGGGGIVWAHVEIHLVGHLKDALPGAFWPPGLCVVTYLLGRRGLSYVLWLAKHGAELPPPWIPVCVFMLSLAAMCWHCNFVCGYVRELHLFLWPWASGSLEHLDCSYL